MTQETALTLKFRGVEAQVLDDMVETGLFNTKSEAIRAALINYSLMLGILNRKKLWAQISKHARRAVSPEQLAQNLKDIENET